MKLKFVATKELTRYLAQDVQAYDGNIVEVSPQRGSQLCEVYPDNFFEVEVKDRDALIDEIIEIFKTPEGFLPVRGLYVTKKPRLNVDYEKE